MNRLLSFLPPIITKRVVTSKLQLSFTFRGKFKSSASPNDARHPPPGFCSYHSGFWLSQFPQNNEGLSIYYLLEKMFVFFRKQSVRESNVNVRFGVEWREGVWHRCRPVRFHPSACKFWPRTAAATEDGEGHRAGGEGWGVCRKWIEWGSEREEEGEWDDRAVGSLFVHASAGKLITRWSSTPLKC